MKDITLYKLTADNFHPSLKTLGFMELNQIVGNLKSFLIKELDAPCSSDTHLNAVLFSVIELLDSDDLDKVYEAEGEGFHGNP